MTKRLILAIAIISIIAPFGVNASTLDANKTVYILSERTLTENAYIAGGQVTVSGIAEKDVVVAGGKVLLTAPVKGDVLVLAGSVDILESVNGDVRVVGGQVTVTKPIKGDLVVVGGTVTVLPSAAVAGDVIIFGGTIDVAGDVLGRLDINGAEVHVGGVVYGPATVHAMDVVRIGKDARFNSSFSYSSPKEAVVAEGAQLGAQVTYTQGGNVRHKEIPTNEKGLLLMIAAVLGAVILVKFVGMLVASVGAVHFFRGFSYTIAHTVVENFWRNAGLGFVVFVLPPIAIMLLVASMIGMYLAFLLIAVYALAILIAGVYTGIIAGAFLSKWLHKELKANWKWAILGTSVVFLLTFVPIIGWVFTTLLFFSSLGAIGSSIWQDARQKMGL